jgi:hypothetical protein
MQSEHLTTSSEFYAFLECAFIAEQVLLACFAYRIPVLRNSILGAHLYTA